MRVSTLSAVGISFVTLACASAFEFRIRWVERIGANDVFIDTTTFADGAPHRLRLQFGVFDDPAGPAPAGGFVGMNIGTISISGAPGNSHDRRTNGRIAPFNFASAPFSNGNPPPAGGHQMGDPPGADFQGWTEIDATLGTQSPVWNCDPTGNPLPQPPPIVRGRNTFVSIYEITTDPSATAESYAITVSGNLIAATEWRTIGTPTPPDCGDPSRPEDDEPGSVTYAPFATEPVSLSSTLHISIPAPPAALVGIAATFVLGQRRRRCP